MPKPKRVSKQSSKRSRRRPFAEVNVLSQLEQVRDKLPALHATSEGAPIQIGGTRLSPEEEKAINILLLRAGGMEDGVQLYRLGWALEDNAMKQDPLTKEYKYDPEHKIPICLEPNQLSYHLLSWTPPNPTDLAHQDKFLGESFEKGTYACIMHFLNPDGSPLNPTASLIERIIPIIKDMHEIATATRKGFDAEKNSLRTKRIARFKSEQAAADKKYESDAEAILESTAPAFEGNPTSFPGPKGKSFSDLLPGERKQKSSLPLTNFAFSAKTPKTHSKTKE